MVKGSRMSFLNCCLSQNYQQDVCCRCAGGGAGGFRWRIVSPTLRAAIGSCRSPVPEARPEVMGPGGDAVLVGQRRERHRRGTAFPRRGKIGRFHEGNAGRWLPAAPQRPGCRRAAGWRRFARCTADYIPECPNALFA